MKAFIAVFRVLVRYWLRHRLQALLCLGGIVLGVAVHTAIEAASRGALQAFAEGTEAFAGRATHRLYAPGGEGVPEAVYARIALAPEVRAIAPLLQGRLRLDPAPAARGGTARPSTNPSTSPSTSPDGLAAGLELTVLGVDPVAESAFRAFSFLEQDGAAEADGTANLERFLADPAALALPVALAAQLGLRVGDRLNGQTSAGRFSFRVAALFRPPPGQRAAFARTVIQDVAAHQERFGKLGRLDTVRLVLRPGAEATVRALLPPGVTLERAGQRMERIETISRAFRLNLEVLGLFALLVALFLIFNATSFAAAQRGATLGTLRCVGATRRTVLAALLAEALLVGGVGSVLGLLGGQWLGALMLRDVGATLFEVVLHVAPLEAQARLGPLAWAVGLSLGMGAALLGAAVPSLRGARVSPLHALRGARGGAAGRGALAGWLLAGIVGVSAAGGLLWMPGRSLAAALGAAALLALGMALLCPPLAALLSRWGAEPLGWLLGTPGRMAARNLGRSLGRTGVAAAALMTALALALAIEITVRSFKHTFELWLDQVVTADIYVEPAAGAPLSEAQLAALRNLPATADVAVLRSRRVVLAEREVLVLALDLPAFARHAAVPAVGMTAAEAYARLAGGAVFVSEALAYPLGLRAGDTVQLPTPQGPTPVTVGAVVRNYSAPQGVVYLSRQHYAAVFGPAPPEGAGVWLRPGADAEAALRALEALPVLAGVRIIPNGALRADALRIFDRTFAVTDVMGTLAAFVAFMAVVSALTALLEERMRSLGYLRAIGVSRRVLGAALGLEALLLAGVAGLASWVAGPVMASVLVYAVNPRAFGWTLLFLPGEGSYGRMLALALGAALLGSVYPVFRATRLSVAATIREE